MTRLLLSEGFRHSVNPINQRHSYTGMLEVGGSSYCVQLRFSEDRYGFPEAYLTEWKSNSALREALQLCNINSDGKVCYIDESQTWWDPHQSVGMIVAALNDIAAVIRRNQSTEWQSAEFIRDFDGYWLAERVLYRAADARGDTAYLAVNYQEQYWLVPSVDIPAWLAAADPIGIWHPLQLKHLPRPSVHSWPPKTVGEFVAWVGRGTLIGILQRLSRADGGAKKKRRRQRFREISRSVSILLSWPDGAGDSEPRIGVQFELSDLAIKNTKQGNYKLAATLLSSSSALIRRYCVANAMPTFIHGRNLPDGYRTLKNHRVVLIGAGTIGGFLASQLCSLGAGLGSRGALHIIDNDRLSPENIARHVLGFADLGKAKAVALSDHLKAHYPYLKIESHATSVWDCQDVLSEATMVINATGSISVGLGLEEVRSHQSATPPILHSWIEGHGLASTAFLSTGKAGDACFRCLVQYRPEGYQIRCKIAKTEEYTEPVIQGCHQSFFPYIVTASNAAAVQAMAIVSDWLNGRLKSTLQYNILRASLVENRPNTTPKQDAKCSICSKNH